MQDIKIVLLLEFGIDSPSFEYFLGQNIPLILHWVEIQTVDWTVQNCFKP